MATLYITEFQALGQSGLPTSGFGPNGPTQAALQPPVVDQTPIVISGASTQSAAFNTATTLVRIHADSVCSVLFGANPTATTANARLASGQTEYFGVAGGMKVAVIANT